MVLDLPPAVGPVDRVGRIPGVGGRRQLAEPVLVHRRHRRTVRGERQQHPHAGVLGEVGRRGAGVDFGDRPQGRDVDDGDLAALRLRHEDVAVVLLADLQVAPGPHRGRQPGMGGARPGVADRGQPVIVGEAQQLVVVIGPDRVMQGGVDGRHADRRRALQRGPGRRTSRYRHDCGGRRDRTPSQPSPLTAPDGHDRCHPFAVSPVRAVPAGRPVTPARRRDGSAAYRIGRPPVTATRAPEM